MLDFFHWSNGVGEFDSKIKIYPAKKEEVIVKLQNNLHVI